MSGYIDRDAPTPVVSAPNGCLVHCGLPHKGSFRHYTGQRFRKSRGEKRKANAMRENNMRLQQSFRPDRVREFGLGMGELEAAGYFVKQDFLQGMDM